LKLIAFYGSEPYYSDKLALTLHNHLNPETGYLLHNTFTVSFTLYKIQLLPHPYDTKCQQRDREHGQIHCLQECLRKGLLPVQRLPFSGILLQDVADAHKSFKDFITIDMINRSMLHHYNELESRCRSSCAYEDCVMNFTTTTVTQETGDPHRFVVSVMIPVAPEARIQTDIAMSLSDFIIQSFSTLGFWLGFSIINLNPFQKLPSYRDKEYVRMLERMWKQRFQVTESRTSPDIQMIHQKEQW
jgi:hypothetical protein